MRQLSVIAAAALVLQAGPLPARADTIQQRLDSYLESYARVGEFSGVAMIAHGDEVVAKSRIGYAVLSTRQALDWHTRFRIASLTKTFTAAAISVLQEQGKLSRTQALADFLPEFPNAKAITIEELLQHSSGVGVLEDPAYVTSEHSLADIVDAIGKRPSLFEPGKGARYSNEGYALLAAVIEKASGESYEQFLRHAEFSPLSLADTGVTLARWTADSHATGHLAADGAGGTIRSAFQVTWPGPGALHSSASDLLAWLKAERDNALFDFSGQGYPCGWGKRTYEGHSLIEQSGEIEGFVSYIAIYAADGYRVVLLSNIESGLLNRIGPDLEKVLFGGRPTQPPRVTATGLSGSSVDGVEGDYHSEQIPVPARIRLLHGQLMQSWGDSVFAHPLVTIDVNTLFGPVDFVTISLVRAPDGSVLSSNWSWDGSPPLAMTRSASH